MKKTFLSLAAIALLIASCGEEESTRRSRAQNKTKTEQTTKTNSEEAPLIDKETMFGIIKSIPSPLETSDLIKSLGIPFSERILNSPDKKSKSDSPQSYL